MRDGIDDTESDAIQSMLYIAVTSRSVVSSLLSLGWVRDDISADEAEAIDWINNMSGAEGMSAVVALGLGPRRHRRRFGNQDDRKVVIHRQ